MVVQRGREGLLLLLWVRLLLVLLLGRLQMLLLVLLMLLVLWRGCWRLMLRGMVLLMMVMVLVVVLLVRRELLTGQIKSAETLGQWGQSRQGHRDAVIVLVAVDELPKIKHCSAPVYLTLHFLQFCAIFFLDIFKHTPTQESLTTAPPLGCFKTGQHL